MYCAFFNIYLVNMNTMIHLIIKTGLLKVQFANAIQILGQSVCDLNGHIVRMTIFSSK